MNGPSARGAFAKAQASRAAAGGKTLLLAPLGAGKTHCLLQCVDALRHSAVPVVFLDLFTAASTPERLLLILTDAVTPFVTEAERETIEGLLSECAADRHRASSGLLRLFELLTARPAPLSMVWVVDEVTEIRSLAYFPDLGQVENPFMGAVRHARGAILSSSYLGLAVDLFPDLEVTDLPPMTSDDLGGVSSLRSDGAAVSAAVAFTVGHAATLLPLVADMKDTRDLSTSLMNLLGPGGALELIARRQYEVLLMRSRGYAVCKRVAEVVARMRGQRLTDLFPHIGRTAGASRQYLRWLVEVGLLTQIRKRYDFADPVVGLWASLYLGRGDHPDAADLAAAIALALTPKPVAPDSPEGDHEPDDDEAAVRLPPKRVDRFEEID